MLFPLQNSCTIAFLEHYQSVSSPTYLLILILLSFLSIASLGRWNHWCSSVQFLGLMYSLILLLVFLGHLNFFFLAVHPCSWPQWILSRMTCGFFGLSKMSPDYFLPSIFPAFSPASTYLYLSLCHLIFTHFPPIGLFTLP